MKKLRDLLVKYIKIALVFINEKIIKNIIKNWNAFSEDLAYELIYYYDKINENLPDLLRKWKGSVVFRYYKRYAQSHVRKGNRIIHNNLRWFFILVLIFIMIFGYISQRENTYHSYLFYTNRKKSELFAEKRAIIKSFRKIDRIKNSLEELLLGPIDPDLINIFPQEAKLLSANLENKTLILNLSTETVLNTDWEKNNGVSIYKLLIYSIADTVFIQFKDINKIKFYFNGTEYRYIGDIGPIDGGVKPDWKILKK